MTRAEREALANALWERAARSGKVSAADAGALGLLGWVMLRRPMLKPGVRFDLTRHRYLEEIFRETAQVVVIDKAAQMGASEYGISYALHAADERHATVLYLFPTDGHVSDFSSARIGPALEASAYLDGIVVDGVGVEEAGHKKRGADRVTLKRIRNNFVYLRGATVKPDGKAPQMKSIDADIVVFDEVDEMDPRAPTIAQKRTGHSAIREERWISTPTYAGIGIDAKWVESDQRLWLLRCEHCGERQALTIQHVVTEWDDLGRPVAWHQEDSMVYAACQRCGKAINRTGQGEWVATFPGREIVGFHLSQLFSPVVDLRTIVRSLMEIDETKRKEAYNQNLGLPYQPKGGQITDGLLDSLRRDYAMMPVSGEGTFLGADVGKLVHVVIRGPQNGQGERPLRFAGAVESFEALGGLISRYGVVRAVIDALPETRAARKVQATLRPGLAWLAYYVQQAAGTKNEEPEQWDGDKGVVNLDRTRTMDRAFARFYENENILPANARDVRDYYDQLKSPVRVVENDAKGQPMARYVEGSADHYAHAENYCAVASVQPPTKKAGTWGRR